MNLRFPLSLLVLGASLSAMAAEPTADQKKSKEALQSLNEFIGKWNGSGGPAVGKGDIWKENLSFGWKFNKDGDTWLTASFDKSNLYKSGEIRYDLKNGKYLLTLTTKDDAEQAFEGTFKRGVLELLATDAKSKDKTRLTMSTNNEGARLVYDLAVQPKGKGLFKKTFTVAHGREGETIAAGKKRECVVTGGLGTIPVSFGGKSYFVCCSGCKDAFDEDPAKFVKEFEAKQKKK